MGGSRIEGSGNRAHAIRMQRVIAQVRGRKEIEGSFETGPQGVAPAVRSAQHMGVGDNLSEAVTDVYTRGQARAPSWVDQLKADMVNGNGSIDPSLAIAKVHINVSGELRGRGGALHDPLAVMRITLQQIDSTGQSAALAHASL
jgi:hypothetical protein